MKKLTILLPLSFIFLMFLVYACDISQPEEVTKPARLKIVLEFNYSDGYPLQMGDFLFADARDFKIFNGKYYTDVFQNPDQFLSFTDSIVRFNAFGLARRKESVQVAYGSIPPIHYDSLLFQITPTDVIRLDGRIYPLNVTSDQVENERLSKVVKIRTGIQFKENQTTTLRISFKVDKIVYRVLDEFVFNAKVDTFFVEN